MGDVFRQNYTRNGQTKTLRKWYGEIPDPNGGKPKRVPLSSDKQVARSMLRDLERKAERRKAGLIDEFDESRQAPLAGLIDEYLNKLALKGDGARHIADTARLLNAVIRECGFVTVADLRADTLDKFLARLKDRGRSARTINTYRQAATGFGHWLVKPKRALRYNTLAESTKAQGDTRVKRRALSLEDLAKLFEMAQARPFRDRQMVRSGPNKGKLSAQVRSEVREKLDRQGRLRVLLYRTAFYTGLRRGELMAIRVDHLTLDEDASFLELPGEFTKNGRDAVIPLRSDLGSELRAWIRDERLASKDFVFPVGRNVAKHLKRDMKAAGIPLIDKSGRIFDFHALRKCTATYMNKNGVPITTAKELLRHSTVELTAGVYNDATLHDLRKAVDQLPKV